MPEDTPQEAFSNERLLLSRCADGDQRACAAFVRRYSNLVYHLIQRILRQGGTPFTPEDLADLHNSVFLAFFENGRRKLRQFRGDNGCRPATWVRLVCVRVVLNHLRRRGIDAYGGHRRKLSLDDLGELPGNAAGAFERMAKAEQRHRLEAARARLVPRERLLLTLLVDRELSPDAAAAAMDISVANVYTLKHRALARLRALVSEAF